MFPDCLDPNGCLNQAQFGNTNSGGDTTGLDGPLGSFGYPGTYGTGTGGFAGHASAKFVRG